MSAAAIDDVGIDELLARRDDPTLRLVDVRSPSAWRESHVRGALHLPVDAIETLAPRALPDRASDVVVYCQGHG